MKTNKVIYWTATGLLALGMAFSAYMYLSRNAGLVSAFQQLGYPLYFMSILGFAKLAGAVVLVAPASGRLKEWAYAGFLFTFAGATWSHLATQTAWLSPVIFFLLLAVSYVFYNRVKLAAAGNGQLTPAQKVV